LNSSIFSNTHLELLCNEYGARFLIYAGADRKREAVGGPLPPIPPKKTKVGATSILGRVGGNGSSGGAEAWEMVAVDCEPAELVPAVLEACNLDEGDKEVCIHTRY
jgi:hypothetical protein